MIKIKVSNHHAKHKSIEKVSALSKFWNIFNYRIMNIQEFSDFKTSKVCYLIFLDTC